MNEKHVGSDFNEFYIEALEETIRDLTGNGDKGEERPPNVVESQIAKRVIGEMYDEQIGKSDDTKHVEFWEAQKECVLSWIDGRK